MRPHQVAALADAIDHLRKFASPADAVLHTFFRAHPSLGVQDRAFVADGAFAFLRRMRSLAALAGTDDARCLALGVALRELGRDPDELAAVARREEAAWLSAFRGRLRTPLPPAVAADLPDWLWERLGASMGDVRRDRFAKAMLEPAPLDLRANSLKAGREAVAEALAAAGIRSQPTPFAPFGLRVDGRPMLARVPAFAEGLFEVQDEGSQIVTHLLAPRRHDFVVDFCAGAGGKTLALGALMRSHGRLYAFDVVDRRLANLKPRLARSGLSNVHAQRIGHEHDPRLDRLRGKVDRVLVDAPCTGFGTLRRNPDLKWRHDEAALAELTAKQGAILAAAARLVKPGGRLVYATCSVLPDENDAIVDRFLAAHPEFAPGDAAAELARQKIPLDTGALLRLSPEVHGCDGFFAAILERAA